MQRHMSVDHFPSFSIFFPYTTQLFGKAFGSESPRVFPGFSGSDLSGMAEVFRRRCRPEATRSAATATGQNVGPGSLDRLGYGSIPIDTFLVGWTSIYQLFWGSLGTRVLTHPHFGSFMVKPLLWGCPVFDPMPIWSELSGFCNWTLRCSHKTTAGFSSVQQIVPKVQIVWVPSYFKEVEDPPSPGNHQRLTNGLPKESQIWSFGVTKSSDPGGEP